MLLQADMDAKAAQEAKRSLNLFVSSNILSLHCDVWGRIPTDTDTDQIGSSIVIGPIPGSPCPGLSGKKK